VPSLSISSIIQPDTNFPLHPIPLLSPLPQRRAECRKGIRE